jgi:hypothetical protein
MCFVLIVEQLILLPLAALKLSVFITETESVYRAVRAEYLKVVQAILGL